MKIPQKILTLLLTTSLASSLYASTSPKNFPQAMKAAQVNAAGLSSVCSFVDKNVLQSDLFRSQFKTKFGISIDACADGAGAAALEIQNYVNDPANFKSGDFVDVSKARDFVDLVGTHNNLFDTGATTEIFPIDYYELAEDMISSAATGGSGSDAGKALDAIQQKLADDLGVTIPAGTPPAQRAAAVQQATIDLAKGDDNARLWLNNNTLTWDPASNNFKLSPIALTKGTFPPAVYNTPLTDYMQTTFATHLQSLFAAQALEIAFLALVNNGGLTVTALNGTTVPTDYSATEDQAKAFIAAMIKEIQASNNAIDAKFPGAVATGQTLSDRVAAALGASTGPAAIAKATQDLTDVMAKLQAVKARSGATSADNTTFAEQTAQSITDAYTTLDTIAPVALGSTAIAATLADAATQIKNAITSIDTSVKAGEASATAGGYHVPVAGTDLATRASGVMTYLAGNSSSSIATYLAALNPSTLGTNPAYPAYQALVTSVESAVPVTPTQGFNPIADIYQGLFANNTFSRAADTSAKTQAAIAYLTSQLYTTYMWLTKTTDLTGKPFAAIPAYTSGTAEDVGAAAQKRVTELIKQIVTLQGTIDGMGAGGTGAAADPTVVQINTALKGLAQYLAPCNLATPVDLPKLLKAVEETNAVVTQLAQPYFGAGTSGLPGGPAANGAILALKISNAIEGAANLDFNTLAINTEQDLKGVLAPCKGLTSGSGLSLTVNTKQLITALSQAVAALNQLSTGFTSPGMPLASGPAKDGIALAKAIEDQMGQTARDLNTSIRDANNTILGGFIRIDQLGTGIAAPLDHFKKNMMKVVGIIQQLAHDAGIENPDATGTIIAAQATDGNPPLTPIATKFTPADLITSIEAGITKNAILAFTQQLLNPTATTAPFNTLPAIAFNLDKLNYNGMDNSTKITDDNGVKTAAYVLRSSIGFVQAVLADTAVSPSDVQSGQLAWKDFAQLQDTVLSKINTLKTNAGGSIINRLAILTDLNTATDTNNWGWPASQYTLANLKVDTTNASGSDQNKVKMLGQAYRDSVDALVTTMNGLGVAPTGPATSWPTFAALQTAINAQIAALKASGTAPATGGRDDAATLADIFNPANVTLITQIPVNSKPIYGTAADAQATVKEGLEALNVLGMLGKSALGDPSKKWSNTAELLQTGATAIQTKMASTGGDYQTAITAYNAMVADLVKVQKQLTLSIVMAVNTQGQALFKASGSVPSTVYMIKGLNNPYTQDYQK